MLCQDSYTEQILPEGKVIPNLDVQCCTLIVMCVYSYSPWESPLLSMLQLLAAYVIKIYTYHSQEHIPDDIGVLKLWPYFAVEIPDFGKVRNSNALGNNFNR